jgi:hypothetical protein
MTPEQGAAIMMQGRETHTMQAIWNFIKTLNRSKVVNGIGAFFALAIPVLVVIGQNLPASWKVTLLVASAVGVLSRAQYLWQKVIPLLDGSSVVQVKPPSQAGTPSLVSVAMDPSQVATNRASVIPMAPMPVQSEDDITKPIPPKGVVLKSTLPPRDPTKT